MLKIYWKFRLLLLILDRRGPSSWNPVSKRFHFSSGQAFLDEKNASIISGITKEKSTAVALRCVCLTGNAVGWWTIRPERPKLYGVQQTLISSMAFVRLGRGGTVLIQCRSSAGNHLALYCVPAEPYAVHHCTVPLMTFGCEAVGSVSKCQ